MGCAGRVVVVRWIEEIIVLEIRGVRKGLRVRLTNSRHDCGLSV